jgi:glutathione S-transferase
MKDFAQENVMLQLNIFGPYFGMPDASPFCIKSLMLLKMSGVQHNVVKMNFRKAPKGKAPYLVDGEQTIADSHFIARHLETKFGVDFSGGYNKEELAKAWAVTRMLEEHLYFVLMHNRWVDDSNFSKGPAKYFNEVPALLRPFITYTVRRKVFKTLHLQGIGRHTSNEMHELAKGDVDAVETLLGDKPYFLGQKPSGIDASILSSLWSCSTSYFNGPLGEYIRSRPILMAYVTRVAAQYFPEFKV